MSAVPPELQATKPLDEYTPSEANELLIQRHMASLRGWFDKKALSESERKHWEWEMHVLDEIADGLVPEDD